ncbi:GntR family transcriptional regulator [Streptomyces laurentii]|uniref:GntR family transcriptional regulator n=1 Tax=Streptomyces laurentii TaxID=39478 RepID=UPI0033F84B63
MPDLPQNPHAPQVPYVLVLDALMAEIKAGKYAPGDKIPSDRELAERFKVARMTARRAIGILRERGLIETRWGAGSYVSHPAGSGIEDGRQDDDQADA